MEARVKKFSDVPTGSNVLVFIHNVLVNQAAELYRLNYHLLIKALFFWFSKIFVCEFLPDFNAYTLFFLDFATTFQNWSWKTSFCLFPSNSFSETINCSDVLHNSAPQNRMGLHVTYFFLQQSRLEQNKTYRIINGKLLKIIEKFCQIPRHFHFQIPSYH